MALLNFDLAGDTGKTQVYDVRSGGVFLGQVRWYAPWRRYCFFPGSDKLFDAGCLAEITEFIKGLMSTRRAR
jgi:hypothetical protein